MSIWDRLKRKFTEDTLHEPDPPTRIAEKEEGVRPEISWDDLKVVVMKAMWPLPRVNPHMNTKADLPRIAAARAKAQEWREWAETEPRLDKRTRRAYLEWCDFCDGQNNEAFEEATTNRQRKEYEDWVARQDRKRERISGVTVPKPDWK